MKVGPRYKICKRLGNGVFEKCQTQKFALSEARTSARAGRMRRGRPPSDYGKQLIEKQKIRFTYGLAEKQLVKYVRNAETKSGDRSEQLLLLLESRLDNVVYRLGLASTRRAARQIVSHGHVLVNNIRVTIPSYNVKMGDKITIREKSKASPLFDKEVREERDVSLPSWLSFDIKTLEGTLNAPPSKETVGTAVDLTTVIEYYSR